MANVHKEKARCVRGVEQDIWDDFDDAAKKVGRDRSSVARDLYLWFIGRTDEMPIRPEK